MIDSTCSAAQADDAKSWALVFAAWLVAATATLGALFFSEAMQIAPCSLCWWQRICMFPLVLILPLGLFPFDRRVARYAAPLAALGAAFAVFHLLLIAGVVPEPLKPCAQGVPCSEKGVVWFGFVSIPLLSLAAFSCILALLSATHIRGSKSI